jgi:hypothetical protein
VQPIFETVSSKTVVRISAGDMKKSRAIGGEYSVAECDSVLGDG